MAPPRRAPANSNVIKLSLDPLTFDQLKAESLRRGDTMDRVAYMMLQLALAALPQATKPTSVAELPSMDVSAFTNNPTPKNH